MELVDDFKYLQRSKMIMKIQVKKVKLTTYGSKYFQINYMMKWNLLLTTRKTFKQLYENL